MPTESVTPANITAAMTSRFIAKHKDRLTREQLETLILGAGTQSMQLGIAVVVKDAVDDLPGDDITIDQIFAAIEAEVFAYFLPAQ